MTVDERIEKLAERHEDLTQSVELLVADGKLVDERLRVLAAATSQMLTAVESHERRIVKLEGGAPE